MTEPPSLLPFTLKFSLCSNQRQFESALQSQGFQLEAIPRSRPVSRPSFSPHTSSRVETWISSGRRGVCVAQFPAAWCSLSRDMCLRPVREGSNQETPIWVRTTKSSILHSPRWSSRMGRYGSKENEHDRCKLPKLTGAIPVAVCVR